MQALSNYNNPSKEFFTLNLSRTYEELFSVITKIVVGILSILGAFWLWQKINSPSAYKEQLLPPPFSPSLLHRLQKNSIVIVRTTFFSLCAIGALHHQNSLFAIASFLAIGFSVSPLLFKKTNQARMERNAEKAILEQHRKSTFLHLCFFKRSPCYAFLYKTPIFLPYSCRSARETPYYGRCFFL